MTLYKILTILLLLFSFASAYAQTEGGGAQCILGSDANICQTSTTSGGGGGGGGGTTTVDAASLNHNVLSNLATGDVHTQYVTTDGTTPMTSNWDIGNFTLTTKGLVASDLTDNRVVIAGTAGILEDDANLTYDGSRLTVNAATVGDYTVSTNSLLAYSSGATAIIGTANSGTGITGNTATGSAGIFNRSGDGANSLLYLNSYGADTGEILLIRNEGTGDSFVLHDGTSNRFDITKTGVMEWWTAPYGAVDTNLYRSAADTLKTDDTFEAATLTDGTLSINSGNVTGGGTSSWNGLGTWTGGGINLDTGTDLTFDGTSGIIATFDHDGSDDLSLAMADGTLLKLTTTDTWDRLLEIKGSLNVEVISGDAGGQGGTGLVVSALTGTTTDSKNALGMLISATLKSSRTATNVKGAAYNVVFQGGSGGVTYTNDSFSQSNVVLIGNATSATGETFAWAAGKGITGTKIAINRGVNLKADFQPDILYGLHVTGTNDGGETGAVEIQSKLYKIYLEDFATTGTFDVAAGGTKAGIWMDAQTSSGTNYGLVLDGDGAGSDIVFGPSQGDRIYRDATTGAIHIDDLVYGEMYANDDNPVTVTIGDNSFTLVDDGTDVKTGLTNGITFQNDNELKVLTSATYMIEWGWSVNRASGGVSREVEGTIGINNTTEQVRCTSHRTIGAGNDTGSMGSSCLLALSANDTVRMLIKNEGGTENLVIQHMNVIVTRVGS